MVPLKQGELVELSGGSSLATNGDGPQWWTLWVSGRPITCFLTERTWLSGGVVLAIGGRAAAIAGRPAWRRRPTRRSAAGAAGHTRTDAAH